MMIWSLQVVYSRIFHYVKKELKDEGACVLLVCVLNCLVKDLVRTVGWCEDATLAILSCPCYMWWLFVV